MNNIQASIKTSYFVILFAAFLMIAGARSDAQPAQVASAGCSMSHRTVVPHNPRIGPDGNILSGQVILQLSFRLDEQTTIQVVEHPRSASNDLDQYNSVIVVRRGKDRKTLPLSTLTQYGSEFRIVEAARFRLSPNRTIAYLAFETPSTGMAEAFAVVQSTPAGLDIRMFPGANQGRIVVNRAEPAKAELWSAKGNTDRIDCDTCRKYYAVYDCDVGENSVVCVNRIGSRATGYSDHFIGERIKIR